MNCFIFQPNNLEDCQVRAFLQSNLGAETKVTIRPAIIICPGGGYGMVSEREAVPVAKAFVAAGYHAFILKYSVGEKAKDFRPLFQLASAIAEVRKNADEWGIDPNRIAVCGFSAGGHLAASLGTLYNEEKFLKICPDLGNIRPDAMVLGYPVIAADEYAHVGSISRVSDSEVGSEKYCWFGLDKRVDETTPPTFMWHTAEDATVPVENSLKFAAALSAVKVPFELHILPKGYHGMSVCTEEVGSYDPYNARWVEWCVTWLDKVFEHRA